MSVRAMTLAFAFGLSAVATADDWPRWRGPNNDGICKETGLLKSWPKNGPPQVWTAKNLGTGFGTPSVAAGLIFGMGTRDGKDVAWAVKEADGSEAWSTPIDDTRDFRNNNGASNTPTYHDGKVYVVTSMGTLAKLDAKTGKEEWRKSFKEFGGSPSGWGYTESVLVDGDKLVCAPAGNKGAVVALKPANGEVIWKTETNPGGSAGYSSPVKAVIHDTPMYVALLGKGTGVVGVHADTGKLLWKYEKVANGVANIPTPIVKGDLVWCSTGYGDGGAALVQIVQKGKGEFEAKEVVYYKSGELQNHHGGMVLVGDHVYFGSKHNNGWPVCVEFATGKIVWGPEKPPGGGSAAVLYADGMLYFRYESGLMALVEANPKEYKLVSSFQLPPPNVNAGHGKQSWPHPVIANGKLYIRDQNVLYCYNVKAGKS